MNEQKSGLQTYSWQETAKTVRTSLATLTALLPKRFTEQEYVIWTDALSDLNPEQIDAAFRKLSRNFIPTSANPFPVPANLRVYVDHAKQIALLSDANNLWESWRATVTRYWYPDIGWKGPKIPERVDRALRAAGGINLIANCSESDLVWRKRDFITCYLRDEESPESYSMVPSNIAKLLAPVATAKSFGVPQIEATKIPDETEPVRKVPPVPMTEAEIEARRELLKDQVKKITDGVR